MPGGSPFEWVLTGLTLLSAALGTMGVLRAKRWADRRRSRRPKGLDVQNRVQAAITAYEAGMTE